MEENQNFQEWIEHEKLLNKSVLIEEVIVRIEMFNFIKKGVADKERDKNDRKEKRKKEKKTKEGGTSIPGSMSSEELLRLDEVRRSLKIRGRRKEKEKLPSGITADYSAEFFAHLPKDDDNERVASKQRRKINIDNNVDSEHLSAHSFSYSDSSETSLNSSGNKNDPMRPPRGILKGHRHSNANGNDDSSRTPDSPDLVVRNTLRNQLITYENVSNIACEYIHEEVSTDTVILNIKNTLTSPSPSADSLTETSSSFATPPFSLSPVGESQGCQRWSRVQDFENDGLSLPLPQINLLKLPLPRELVINRQNTPKKDFGFSLRNAIRMDRSDLLFLPDLKPTIFAEPGNGGENTGLLPGDRLIAVNGKSVEDLSRNTIIEMIRNCDDSVRVKVQPVAELVELSRRSMANGAVENGNGHHHEMEKDSVSSNNNDVWLVHKGGFTAAVKLSQNIGEKISVTLKHNGDTITVDEDDLEKANPPEQDLVEDLCNLKHLNEASVLHCIRQRFGNNLIHTKAGNVLIVVNPMQPLSLYSEKVVSMFRGCKTEDTPPHIYSMSQAAYRSMIATKRDQSIVFSGRSGSGKTASFKHSLYYLSLASGSTNQLLTVERINAINKILESFGNTRTLLNSNASRFTQIMSLDFDHSGVVASASIQVLLLEKSRAGRLHSNENSFHVLSHLVGGADPMLLKELNLDNISKDETGPNAFATFYKTNEELQKATSEFAKLVQSFVVLNVSDKHVKAIWNVLGAIVHLGFAGITTVESGGETRLQFVNPTSARLAANLLGITMEDLTSSILFKRDKETIPKQGLLDHALEYLDSLVIGLYSEVFARVVSLINKAIQRNVRTVSSILLVDTPGFQNPSSCGSQDGAKLFDLQHNYLQERLQLLFHEKQLVAPRTLYSQELVEIDKEVFTESDPGPLISLLDKVPQNNVVRSTSQRDNTRRSLFTILDEESTNSTSSDEIFYDRICTNFSDREYHFLLRPIGHSQFMLQHMQGTNPVLYTVNGWLKQNKNNFHSNLAANLLQDSHKSEINELFAVSSSGTGDGRSYGGSIGGVERSQSLRRISSLRRSFTTLGGKRNSPMMKIKLTVDGIIDTISRTGTHFVHCFLVQHNAATFSKTVNSTLTYTIEDIVNVPLLRSQIRGFNILEAAQLHKLGFPESIPHSEFSRRFSLLIDGATKATSIEAILSTVDIDKSQYRIGPSQVLLRSGVLARLEAKREELLRDRIIHLQAYCRGYLARQRVSRKRVQDLAIRCIQRNFRVFLKVKDWPWWRLLVRITPLLDVNRTDEQLKVALSDIQSLKQKLEKSDAERNFLKGENEKLECKLSEMTVDLSEERSNANIANERLDAEMSERIKLTRELEEQQEKNREMQNFTEKLELDLIAANSNPNDLFEDEDLGKEENLTVFKMKYDRAVKELEFTKRRMQTQHEYDLDQLVGLKKQLEKKLADAYEEVEEQRQVVGQWKRKSQKFSVEMNDLRLLLEEQNSRNTLLEKRQRKFDAECQTLQDSARQERQAKERLGQEKDSLIAEKFTLEQTLADVRQELDLTQEKLTNLQRDMEELSYSEQTEEEIAQLKRSKIESERKCKEQEDELDEMAGQIQLLEQAKLRLEMTLETMRKEARHEAQQRDDELEEVRGSFFKKIKGLECQLENEHEERTLLLREKHELERRLQTLEQQDHSDRMAEEAANLKLKRDLRKYKALFKDAQIQIDRMKGDAPSKNLIRQLRNQLEDAEAARTLAIKSKQLAESELSDVQSMLEDVTRARHEADEKAAHAGREVGELRTQLEENEEELSELIKKYSSTVKQLNSEQLKHTEYEATISELEAEKVSLKEHIAELNDRLENVEVLNDSSTNIQTKRLVLRTKELESKLELEHATRSRLEVQCNRHKESLEKTQTELMHIRSKETLLQEELKKIKKTLRETKDELHALTNRDQDHINKRQEASKKLETTESELASVRNDLRLALQRIADLQQAMEDGDYDDDSSESDLNDLSDGSISPVESTYLQNKRIGSIDLASSTNSNEMKATK